MTNSTMQSSLSANTPSVIATKPKTTKLNIIVKLLSKPNGASLAELSSATGWHHHSLRGAFAGALKKKGFKIHSNVVNKRRRYRICHSK